MIRISTKILKMAAVLYLAGATATMATIVDQWDFTYADGTGLADALSNNGVNLGGNSAFAVVQGNALEFNSDNTDGSTTTKSTFRTTDLSQDPITAGIVEVSWTLVSSSMVNTDGADGSARVGFSLRDTDPINDDLGFVRLQYRGGPNEFRLEFTDALVSNSPVASFSGNTISDLKIRYQLDLDNTGSAGSFQLWYTESGMSEVHAITNGVVPTGGQVDQLRTVQQVTNGGTDWRQGDTMVIDNLAIQIIPEPSTAALMAVLGGTLAFWRRRR